MKLIGRTIAVLAAGMVVVGFWLAVGALSGSSLGGIVQILPTLAIVAIVTAIVAPIKQRLLSKRQPNALACGPKFASPAA